MRITDQYFWTFVFGVFFLILVVMGAIILQTESRIPLSDLKFTDYALMTLATWRLTRLVVCDTIMKFLREQFYDLEKTTKGYVLVKAQTGPRRTLADLTSCSWCFGMWAAAMVIFLYLITSYAVFPVMLLAVSAVGSFLQIFGNLVGHKAEQLKNQNEA
jgi:hypothetical protein